MIRTDQERQAWHDELMARAAQPNDVSDRVQTPAGKTFVRTLGKRCHWCGKVFFAYQVEGQERQPYQVDPNPERGQGMRETCGNPLCWDAEDTYQFQRRRQIRLDEATSRATQQALAAGPAQKGGKRL